MKTLNRYVWIYLSMVIASSAGHMGCVRACSFMRRAVGMVAVVCFVQRPDVLVSGTVAPTFEPTLIPTVNEAPRVEEGVGIQYGRVGDEFTFQLVKTQYFSDAQGDDFTLAAVAKNETHLYEWLSFNAQTQTFSGVPTKGGGYPVEVRATDEKGATSDPLFFTIQIARKPAEDYRLLFDILKVFAPIIAVFVGLITTAYCCSLCRKRKKNVEKVVKPVNDEQEEGGEQKESGGHVPMHPVYIYRRNDPEQTMLVSGVR